MFSLMTNAQRYLHFIFISHFIQNDKKKIERTEKIRNKMENWNGSQINATKITRKVKENQPIFEQFLLDMQRDNFFIII